jgi:hypothetical protein
MAEEALRVVGKYPLNLGRGISAMRDQELKRLITPSQ